LSRHRVQFVGREVSRKLGVIAPEGACETMEINQQIANQVKHLRTEKGLTQCQLGCLTGMKQSVIARIESGKIRPTVTVRTLEKIADALDLELCINWRENESA